MILSARRRAPDIQAQWLKTSGITVRHLLWLLLALTHVAFAIDPNEPPAELNRTCGSNPDRAPDGSGTFAQSAGADLWLESPSRLYRFDSEHFEPSDGGYSPGQAWSPAQGPKRALGPYGPGERLYYGATPTSSSGWQRVSARFFQLVRLAVDIFLQPMLNQQLTRKKN